MLARIRKNGFLCVKLWKPVWSQKTVPKLPFAPVNARSEWLTSVNAHSGVVRVSFGDRLRTVRGPPATNTDLSVALGHEFGTTLT